MKYGSAQINDATSHSATRCVVLTGTPLETVARRIDTTVVPYVLVEDENGRLIGIAETEHILERLSSSNEVERKRWSRMPVEAALQWKIGAQPADGLPGRGSSLPVQCTTVVSEDHLLALVTDDDVFVSWRAVLQSLTESSVDPVTSLPNRVIFERRLGEELERAQREQHSLAVVLFDVDHFKEVNDQFGHSAGDTTLRSVASLLKKQLRSYDVLARYGGDEFAATCCACEPGEIDIPLLRIREALAAGFNQHLSLPDITLSIGAAVVHDVDSTHSVNQLVELADICLYRAKENGRNCAYKMELRADLDDQPVAVTGNKTLTESTPS